VLALVEKVAAGPLGNVAGEMRVRSFRGAAEKPPWRDLQSLEGSVEANFVFPAHVGDTILPFRPLDPRRAVIPWDGARLLDSKDEALTRYPGLHDWWMRVEKLWNDNRSSERFSLLQRFDYQRTLRNQFMANGLCAPIRVVYSKSGMYLAAAVITDPSTVIDHKLYWAACSTISEADYLCAILNSEAVTQAVRRFQARGEHNPRDFDMYVWQLSIPEFDPKDALHANIAGHGADLRGEVAKLAPPKTRFEKQRRFVRESITAMDVGRQTSALVTQLIGLR
jgi:hypothetical protein